MSKIFTIAPLGLEGVLVEVEANLTRHLPKIVVVGLPDLAVQEARERVWAAIENSGCRFPRQKIVVNLSPAQIRKEGGAYDLPMAVAILVSAGEIDEPEDKTAFIGELSLTGALKSVPGVLVMVSSLQKVGFKKVYVPKANAKEAAVVKGIEVFGLDHLSQIIEAEKVAAERPTVFRQSYNSNISMSDIQGQEQAKRVLQIAAAGGHNVLMVGPPGSGKTMLSKAFLSLLPPPSLEESLEVSKIHSLVGLLSDENHLIDGRIVRSPHHSASVSSIIGGGTWPRPGEISLAHNNVLFLDELLEFPRQVLESLRQPLEDRVITVSRVKGSVTFPANFILLATANPCPCGYLSDPEKECSCSQAEIIRYQKRLSGPVMDRIDLHLYVPRVKASDLRKDVRKDFTMQHVVSKARKKQLQRSGVLNSSLDSRKIKQIKLDRNSQSILDEATNKMNLSARAYFKVIKVARTIADLEMKEQVEDRHILESLQYRQKVL